MRDIPLLLGVLELLVERPQHGRLHLLARLLIDRVCDVGVEPRATALVEPAAVLREARAAVVAVPGTDVVLAGAGGTAIRELATRHRDEEPARPLDDLDVADDDPIVHGDA